MGRFLVPVAFVTSMLALGIAAITVAFAPGHPSWWGASVHLAVLGGFVPIIYAVNIRIVPVFARRDWRGLSELRLQILSAVGGAWLVFLAQITGVRFLEICGLAAVFVAAILFMVNVGRLFRQPLASRPALPLPYPGQAAVDRLATKFTRLSGVYLFVGLAIGLVTSVWTPRSGRWDLVWAHTMLIGFLLSMISGVTYHVLPRWTDRRWRSLRTIQLHFLVSVIGLPIMLLAFATARTELFKVAGPLQAAALALFLVNALPLALGLPKLTRASWIGAAAFLLIGISLGAAFAIDPVLGVRLRYSHAEINLFGWGGMLISGMAYYLVPRFAGNPLSWPRLAAVQIGMLASGVILGAMSLGWRGYGHHTDLALAISQTAIAAALMTLAIIIGSTFSKATPVHVQSVQIKLTPGPNRSPTSGR